jgi:hypothetical protein
LVKAGLKALAEVRGDMLARQARIFELLLGIGQAPGWRAGPAEQAPDPFGKFDDVFDQRIARAGAAGNAVAAGAAGIGRAGAGPPLKLAAARGTVEEGTQAAPALTRSTVMKTAATGTTR